jgi:glutathione S-transferase
MALQLPSLKLTHFIDDGRAEAARLAFFVGGVPFVDERITRDEFQSRKDKLPFTRLPVLEVDGEALGETNAILRFAGRLSGVYPVGDPFAALRIDEILNGLEEFTKKIGPCLDDQQPDALRRALAKHEIPRYFSLIDARLNDIKSLPFFQEKSSDVLIHELAIYAWVTQLRSGSVAQFTPDLFDKFRFVNEAVAKVLAHPRVKQWYLLAHDSQLSEPESRDKWTAPTTNMGGAQSLPLPKLKLTYFFSTGRAEAIRLALAIGDILFEDEHISCTEFATIKSSLPFHKLPVLRVDNQEPVAQSHAILRYVGTLSGLYPVNDPVKALRVDELLSIIDEGHNNPLWSESFIEDPEKKLAMRSSISHKTIPKMLGFLDSRLDPRMGPYATGQELTVADLSIAALVMFLASGGLDGVPADIAKPYKNLPRIVNLVNNHPRVHKWRRTHPLPTP